MVVSTAVICNHNGQTVYRCGPDIKQYNSVSVNKMVILCGSGIKDSVVYTTIGYRHGIIF